MIEVKFDDRKLTKRMRKLSKKWIPEVKKQVYKSANEIHREAVNLVPVGADAQLKNSLEVNLKDKGFAADVGTGVLSGEKLVYAEAIEFGRKPGGFPPWKENSGLYRWVRLKLGITGKMTKSVAFLIARKVADFGFKGQPYLIPSFKNEEKIFNRKIKDIFKKVK